MRALICFLFVCFLYNRVVEEQTFLIEYSYVCHHFIVMAIRHRVRYIAAMCAVRSVDRI